MAKTTKQLVPKSISQPNAFQSSKKTIEKQPSTSIFHKNSGYLSFNCKYWGGWADKSFRQWSHPEKIIKGDKTQCGTTEKRYGSKNEVQHIGSPTGDIPRPAMLHMYNFDKSFLNTSSKIDNITVSFSYRVVNVTDSGKLWTENLAASELAIINGLHAWFGSWNQSTKLSSVKHDTTQLKYEGKNKKGYIWKTITLKFTDITAADIFNSNFAFNLQFGMNCSKASTPCFLYIDNFKINVTYENSKKYITGYNNTNVLYTGTEDVCVTGITQTIEAGYMNGNTKVSPSKAPAKLGSKIKVCNQPSGVTISKIGNATDTTATFSVIDKTNIPGDKSVTYCLNDDASTKIVLRYTAIQRPKPTFSITEEYKSYEDFNSNKSYIVFKDGCASKIKIYVDSVYSTPLTLDVTYQNSTTNLLNETSIRAFHTFVTALSCGYHTLYIQRGDENLTNVQNNTVQINIKPMEYKFKIYSEDNPTLTGYQQRKKDSVDHPRYASLKIQRIDDEPRATIPSVKILDETSLTGEVTYWTNVKKGDYYKDSKNEDYKIDLYYSGEYFIQVVENRESCVGAPSIAQVSIDSTHKQNYDYLFTKGSDATTFDFDYLVAWEGDNIKTPINTSDIILKHSIDDVRICSKSVDVGLSQIGLAELKVTNKTEDDDFEHVKIELNTLIKNDNDAYEVTTDEWVSPQGIFNNFYNLFYEFNLNDNVTVENLTPDNDLIDEENVYLHIKSIPAGDTITIYLPYRSTIEKTVYLQYLLLEQTMDIYPIESCDVPTANTTTNITLSVTDSMQTQLTIDGNVDLLNLDDNYECPEECYSTIDPESGEIASGGITYTITNVDTNDFGNQVIQTEIINDNELQPYGYYYKSQYYEINNTDNQPLQWVQQTDTYNKNLIGQLIHAHIKFPSIDEKVITQRTDKKGNVKFFIQIPEQVGRSYTIKELLSEVLYFKYNGVDNFNSATLAETNNTLAQYDNIDINKNNTILTYSNNYRRYKAGEIAYIPVSLTGVLKIIKNKLIFNASLGDIGSSDQVTVLYRICNIKNNQGIFKTTFKTNDKLLIPQEVSQKIYCGINTELDLKSRLDKQIVEKEHLNVLYINIANKHKVNKDVYVKINLGQVLPQFKGNYDFVDINIDAGDYSIAEQDNNIIVTWLLGEMQEYQKNKAIVKIQAKNIGLSDIKINAFDYLHTPDGNIEIQNNKCPKCEENSTYVIKNSPWEKIGNTWYKLINNVYYQPIRKDGEIQWIAKE